QPCSSIRATEPAITPSAIPKDTLESFRPCLCRLQPLYEAGRKPGPITEAACWAHGRRKFFVLADITAKVRGKLSVVAPLALAAIKRIDAIFDIEREISGLSADELSAAVRSHRWLQTSKPGCGPNAPNSLAILRWPRRWTTCSSAGPPLHASST